MKSLHIATRKSPLALCQAALVKQALLKHFPALEIIFVLLTTTGDRILSQPLADIGGKGLFIKEIETALLTHQADIAVHSMKDMPVEITAGLEMAAYLEREDPRDVLVSLKYKKLADIPPGSKIGTASLRRQNMLRQFRQDWVM
jgi:hydroxymethylbilane synthase